MHFWLCKFGLVAGMNSCDLVRGVVGDGVGVKVKNSVPIWVSFVGKNLGPWAIKKMTTVKFPEL